MEINWTDFKTVIDNRSLSIQWVAVGLNYWLKAIDGNFEVECIIPNDPAHPETSDFETNYKSSGNRPPVNSVDVKNSPEVTTQYELNDKNLKLAKGKILLDGTTNSGSIVLMVPGTPNTSDGRYVAGGYAISGDYNPDDYVTVWVEDNDRLIGWAIAQSQDPNATAPVSDETIRAMGTIPGLGSSPEYPILRSYTDRELPVDNQGWYFWPLAQGNSLPPVGETEIEPIGGYGFIPAGFYIRVIYVRPTDIKTGACRLNIYWGKKE